jgi:hypothetical protein
MEMDKKRRIDMKLDETKTANGKTLGTIGHVLY